MRGPTVAHVVEGAARCNPKSHTLLPKREAAETRRQELLRHLKPCPWGAFLGFWYVSALLRPAVCSALLKGPTEGCG